MSVTLMVLAPLITWLLVSTTPDESSTIPVPAACTFGGPSWVLMSTKPGPPLPASAGRSSNPPAVPDEPGAGRCPRDARGGGVTAAGDGTEGTEGGEGIDPAGGSH